MVGGRIGLSKETAKLKIDTTKVITRRVKYAPKNKDKGLIQMLLRERGFGV